MAQAKPGDTLTQAAPVWRRWLARWLGPSTPPSAPPAAAPKSSDRHARRVASRERLYAVVRENMIRAGVLSSTYKFKVLTLDHDGLSHLVLVDVARSALDGVPGGTDALESSLQALARERLQLEVRAVYWRVQDSLRPRTAPPPHPPAPPAEDVTPDELAALRQALQALPGHPAPAFEPTRPMVRNAAGFDPLSETQLGDLK